MLLLTLCVVQGCTPGARMLRHGYLVPFFGFRSSGHPVISYPCGRRSDESTLPQKSQWIGFNGASHLEQFRTLCGSALYPGVRECLILSSDLDDSMPCFRIQRRLPFRLWHSLSLGIDSFIMSSSLIRSAWIEASHFHEMTEEEVLREVSRRVSEVRARATSERSSHPLVLLDLDSTLYEVGPRTHQILKEWSQSPEAGLYARVQKAMMNLLPEHVGYSLKDTFTALDLVIDHEQGDLEIVAAWESAKKFWQARFFTSDYLKYDLVYPGAPEFAQEVYRLGAEIAYLTGRDEPGMGDGTRERLLKDGFPWDMPRTHLLMKAAAHMDDLEHKQEAAHYIRAHGSLIASFENEPPNVVALQELFPDAMHVFMETVCSDRPAARARDLFRIRNFLSHHKKG